MKKRPKKTEEPVDEGWLLPYADMLTLLLALFIVMFAMAKTDDSKIQELGDEFSIIFSGKNSGGSTGILPGHPSKKVTDKDGESVSETKVVEQKKGKDKIPNEENKEIQKDTDVERMQSVGDSIKNELSEEGFGEEIDVSLEQDGLRIAIKSGVLFAPGSAAVTPEIEEVVKKIATSLKDLDNDLIIAGYTDNVPSNTTEYPSNWELSAARAMTVMKLLVKHHGIEEDRVSVQAYGEYKPKVPNNTEENRARNRRVEIFVVKQNRDK